MAVYVEIRKNMDGFSLNLQFQSNSKRIGILGASGCGKSMTLKSIAGIETPEKGQIQIGDRILFDSGEKINIKPQKRNAGYLFQNYALFPTMTVEQNIGAGLRGRWKEKKEQVQEMIGKFGLSGLEGRLPGELSGGQQQRTALARIMAYEPEIILLDEPYAALDMFLRDRLQQELLDMLRDYEGTVILVSHNRDEIYRFSDDLLIMEKGQAACFGKSKDIFSNPKKKVAAGLTGCKNFSKVRRIDDHRLEAADFGIVLCTERKIPENTAYIGFRAHEFEPVWGMREKNCMKVQVESAAQLPFEKQYFLRPEGAVSQKEDQEQICWFVQRDRQREIEKRGLPPYLKFTEEHILFLEE